MTLTVSTANRVRAHTPPSVNRRIADDTAERLERIGQEPAAIRQRLRELDREWDVERAIQLNASTLMLVGTVLGLRVNPRFLALPVAVSAFLLQHALQGWCPPLPVLRRLGFRTSDEIGVERHALEQRLQKRTETQRAPTKRPAAARRARP